MSNALRFVGMFIMRDEEGFINGNATARSFATMEEATGHARLSFAIEMANAIGLDLDTESGRFAMATIGAAAEDEGFLQVWAHPVSEAFDALTPSTKVLALRSTGAFDAFPPEALREATMVAGLN